MHFFIFFLSAIGTIGKVIHELKVHIFQKPIETLKVSVPSMVYYVQNNLLIIGATHLDATTSQITYQLKILTTALFSVALLRKRLYPHQWIALILLFIGVGLVQVQQISAKKSNIAFQEQSPIIGFFAILTACVLSGMTVFSSIRQTKARLFDFIIKLFSNLIRKI